MFAASLPTKSDVTGAGFVPPIRISLFPMDARHPRMRRGLSFPLPPGSMCRASRDYFPSRDFHGPPPPPFAVRNVYPLRAFAHYLPPRARFSLTPTP